MIKGIHIDLKAHTANFHYLMQILHEIRDFGFNTILLEYQDKFPYSGKYKMLAAPDALTLSQIEQIKDFCAENAIELIPVMQCLGHMYWVTRFEGLKELGESYLEKGAGSHSLCPSKKESLELFKALAEQVMSVHNSSKYFHIGGDEIHFSDTCSECTGKDHGTLLGEYYKKVFAFVEKCSFIPAMWGDMIVKYENVKQFLDKRALVFDWDYIEGLSEQNGKSLYPDERSYSEYSKASFVNTKKLIDEGFRVVCAPAVRSMGDSCFLPRNVHFDNCLQSIAEARRCCAEGFVVTSWAVRRAPWQLTKNVLFAVSRFAEDEKLTAREMRIGFAEETFGNKELSELPFELSEAVHAAKNAADFISSGCDFMDADSGHFLPEPWEKRLCGVDIRHNEKVKAAYMAIRDTALTARKRLCELPQNDDVKMWIWACDNAIFYGSYVYELCDNFENQEWIEKQLKKFDTFCEELIKPLGKYLTEFSLCEETVSRADTHKKYLKDLRKGAHFS